jgi:hypothetical protein
VGRGRSTQHNTQWLRFEREPLHRYHKHITHTTYKVDRCLVSFEDEAVLGERKKHNPKRN